MASIDDVKRRLRALRDAGPQGQAEDMPSLSGDIDDGPDDEFEPPVPPTPVSSTNARRIPRRTKT